MGKNRHSKDKIHITATEWATEYGGKKNKQVAQSRPLPFTYCALGLIPYNIPVILGNDVESTEENPLQGVIFDYETIAEHILKYKTNPITGEPCSTKDIIKLNMAKTDDGQWQCPITNKIFTNNSHVVAVRTTRNVYSYDAVLELNIKPKNYVDLITGETFNKSDIITLQNPNDEEHMKLRDISNFTQLATIREENGKLKQSESKIRLNPTAEKVLKELESNKDKDIENRKRLSDYVDDIVRDKSYKDDVKDILDMKPTIDDINPGQINSDGKASISFTSTITPSWSSNATRSATADEIRDALWKKMRQLGKKGYIQLQTDYGNLNVEIHCDIAPRTSWNFLTLCKRGYYDNTPFHRLVKGFMLQGGDPTGKGNGGKSAFESPFKDEIDTRILHDARGVLSMANSGPNTNGSQFFITFAATKHLDLVHSVFGKVVGGAAVLDRIEAIGNDKHEKPLSPVNLLKVVVYTNPIDEARTNLINFIQENIDKRLSKTHSSALPQSSQATGKRLREDSAEPTAKKTITATTSSSAPPKKPVEPAKSSANIAAFMKSNAW